MNTSIVKKRTKARNTITNDIAIEPEEEVKVADEVVQEKKKRGRKLNPLYLNEKGEFDRRIYQRCNPKHLYYKERAGQLVQCDRCLLLLRRDKVNWHQTRSTRCQRAFEHLQQKL